MHSPFDQKRPSVASYTRLRRATRRGPKSCTSFSRVITETRPLMLKANKSISAARDGDLYSGCYADVKLSLWAQDNQYGKRINAQCLVFQKRADGGAFAGGPPPSADGMDDLSDVGEAEDLVG